MNRGLKTPLVLTVNGRAELVVQDAESYQEMLDRLERAETVAAIRRGMKDAEEGKITKEQLFAGAEELMKARLGVKPAAHAAAPSAAPPPPAAPKISNDVVVN